MESFIPFIKENILNAKPHIMTDRARIATEVYQENPASPSETRRAKTFKRLLEELPVHIREGEVIVGVEGKQPGDALLMTEFATEWLAEDIDGFDSREDNSLFLVSSEAKEEILRAADPLDDLSSHPCQRPSYGVVVHHGDSMGAHEAGI